ncbi:hypothetical protein D1610_01060 [Sphingomonas gilva]|uniref:Uncharacterized protein n=1 Tax=Sphingomonas gilva TaxID=2305907 RepID=A0A396RQL1_9SPHN|nr:hypothetical protein [Sphingomonas gilva]RHW18778.1 hypothetical protein D1610_01060 [Sphingomonas gilva]
MSVLLALAIQAATARQSLGLFERWGAFSDPQRCFAIAQPVRAREGGFASIASFPARGLRNQFHARLSRARSPRAQVTLSIGERRFQLVAGTTDAWAPDARTDAAIVAAIRSARSMSVESVDAKGRAYADTYALRGAATAIDAAAVACARR